MRFCRVIVLFSIFYVPAATKIYSLSLHDALPIFLWRSRSERNMPTGGAILAMNIRFIALFSTARQSIRKRCDTGVRSEEHTSELQSRLHLVCRLLLEKKNKPLKRVR